jgi:hypothetical protein
MWEIKMGNVTPWFTQAGKYKIEHIGGIPHFNIAVDLAAPRTGVLHTMEGDFDSGLAVFKQHYAPHFIVGPGRIAQLVQIGTIGAALVTHNDHAIVQIEVAGFSKETLWDFDNSTTDALASLMALLQRELGIPLFHPWPDGDFGRYGDNPHRHAGKWGVVAGWYGHDDVPSPDVHWDPGNLEWSKLLAKASSMTDILHSPGIVQSTTMPPRPCTGH